MRLHRRSQGLQARLGRGVGEVERGADHFREGGSQAGDGAVGAAGHGRRDERLGADVHRQSEVQERLDLRERRLAHLQAGQVLGCVPNARDDVERDRIPAPGGEGVDVEGERRTGVRGRHEVGGERIGIQREVRRRDDGDRIRPDLGRVGREGRRLGRGLRAAVNEELAADRGAEDDHGTHPLIGAEQDPLPGGAAGEDTVPTMLLEESDHGPDGRLVERTAAGSQRRRGRDDERWAVGHGRKGSGFGLVAVLG